jgi:membrane protease YdiL (CAAX protease family)
LFRRFKLARMPGWAWMILVVGFPAIVYSGAALSGTAGDTPVFSPWYTALPVLAQMLFFAGTVEELGWRGVALPLLQRRFNPLISALVLGVAHAVWHLPAFALSGSAQSAWSFGPYFAGVVALSVIFTSLFNASKGSLLIAWLVHFQAMNPLFTDGQPWDAMFYVVTAVALVIFDRRRMVGGADAVIEIIAPDPEDAEFRS